MEKLLNTFNKKGFKAKYFETKEAARAFILDEIQGTSVGFGGSMTVSAMNLVELLGEKNKVYYHGTMGREVLPQARTAQVYISSANAITKTGDIINIDAFGNRVSATIFGAEKVFFICGVNKIAENIEDGIFRARNIAAPKNAVRLGRKTPCALKGDKCYDCASPDRLCRNINIMCYPVTSVAEMHVIIINEELGY